MTSHLRTPLVVLCKQRSFFLLTFFIWALLPIGCNRPSDPDATTDEAPTLAQVTDLPRSAEGIPTRSAQMPVAPQRIISMAPSVTELLFTLGMGDRVVAVTRYCDWPDTTADLPKIGGMLDPDFEAILAHNPDLVLGVEAGSDHNIVPVLQSASISYGFLQANNVHDITTSIKTLGTWLGTQERAHQVILDFETNLNTISSRLKARAPDNTSVLLVYDQDPIVAAGPGTFGDELLTMAGLHNALDANPTPYPILDLEQVLSLNPTIILDVSISPPTSEVLAFWNRFDALDAVQNDRVIHLNDPLMMRPGPRLPEALRLLGDAIEEL